MICTGEPNIPVPAGAPPGEQRTAAEFWELYERHVAGEFGGDPGDPGNAWEYGALALDGLLPGQRVPDRFDLPAAVAAAFQRAADLYERYVDAVEEFDGIDPRWIRQRALRLALPGAPPAVLKALLAALDSVDTSTLVATCTAAQPSGVPA